MIFLNILISLVAIALPSYKQNLSLILIRIFAIIFICSAVLSFNALYIQSIGSGIGIYSELLYVTIISQILDIILFILAALIAFFLINISKYNKVLSLKKFFTLLKSKDGSSSFYYLYNSYKNLQLSKSKFYKKLYDLYKLNKINIIGFYVPKTEYCLIILSSLLESSLLISSSIFSFFYFILELQFFSLYNNYIIMFFYSPFFIYLNKNKYSYNRKFSNKIENNDFKNTKIKIFCAACAEKEFYNKSLILKKKLESENYILSNLDLRIFKIIFENDQHIVLKHTDINNNYQVEVSILKYNPQIIKDFLVYHLTYTELNFNSKNEILETLKWSVSWVKEVDFKKFEYIGNGNHPLELFIDYNNWDFYNHLTVDINNKLEIFTFKLLLIETESICNIKNQKFFISPYKNIYNIKNVINYIDLNKNILKNNLNEQNYNLIMNSNDFIKNINENFIINGKFLDINNNILIKNKNLYNNIKIDNYSKLIVKYNYFSGCQFNTKLKENNVLYSNVSIIKIINKKIKINSLIDLNKNNKIINNISTKKFFKILKFKYQSKIKSLIYNKKNFVILNDIKIAKQIIIKIENTLNKNIPVIFFVKHIYTDISKYIEMNNDKIKNRLSVFLKDQDQNLMSTFAFLLTKDNRGKKNFNLLHFNHETGYIINNINIKTHLNDKEDLIKNDLNKNKIKFDENFKLTSFIWKEIVNLKKNFLAENNNNSYSNFNNSSLNLVQLSLNTLDYTNDISKLRKKKLLKMLNKIELNYNIKFKIININKFRKQECLQLFYIIYNNNPNISIDNIINNYNALIKKKINVINKSIYNF